ncbi:MAG: two pore domain potassium channel family protein [Breznakibacter sp.]|nr:two pore domain potassium channel family protein [Breznakibacter sp.]
MDLHPRLKTLQYFSYITVATVGYGDVAPITQLAKKSTILLSLVGYFYSAFVTSIIIGKYIAYSNSEKMEGND